MYVIHILPLSIEETNLHFFIFQILDKVAAELAEKEKQKAVERD